MTQSIISSLSQLETTLKTDLIQAAGTPLISFLAAIQSNPSATNLAGQWITLTGALIGSLPNLEAAAVSALAQFLQGKISAWEASAVVPPAAPVEGSSVSK